MNKQIRAPYDSVRETLSRISHRTRWSLIDQVLISGVNVMTSILLVRALGLHAYGVYSLVLLGVQFVAAVQLAGILAPMMSMFDQRGETSQSSYLATVLLHQTFFSGVSLVAVFAMLYLPGRIASYIPIKFGLLAALLVTTQFQDLVRRFFFVSERPMRAFLNDSIVYGSRLLLIGTLALKGALTLNGVWTIIAATSLVAVILFVPDLARLEFSKQAIGSVTEKHRRIAGWMVGNAITQWISSNFLFLIIGTVIGPVQLGGVRAVQNLINVANLMLQALENFVPSAATKSFVHGNAETLFRYVTRISLIGTVAIAFVTAILVAFADPIMNLVYRRTFSDQMAILAILGTFYALGHTLSVVSAGLRTLGLMRAAFWSQTIVGFGCVVIAWYVARSWGVVGALLTLLIARIAVTGQLVVIFHHSVKGLTLGLLPVSKSPSETV